MIWDLICIHLDDSILVHTVDYVAMLQRGEMCWSGLSLKTHTFGPPCPGDQDKLKGPAAVTLDALKQQTYSQGASAKVSVSQTAGDPQLD